MPNVEIYVIRRSNGFVRTLFLNEVSYIQIHCGQYFTSSGAHPNSTLINLNHRYKPFGLQDQWEGESEREIERDHNIKNAC